MSRPTREELLAAVERYGAAVYSDADEPGEARRAMAVITAFADAAEESPPVIVEFPTHDLRPGGYDADWQPRHCPRCHESVSSVRSSEFGTEPGGTWLAGHYRRGPCGVCRSKPPVLYVVLAPDGRLSCATLPENAVARIHQPEWRGSVLVKYAPVCTLTAHTALHEEPRRG